MRKQLKKDIEITIVLVVGIIYTLIKKDIVFTEPFNYVWGLGTILLGTFLSIKVIAHAKEKNKNKKYLKYDFRQIDKMDGIAFEGLLAEYFKLQGYHVVLTPASNDYGADLVLGKSGETIVVQAKRYKNKVNNKAVQEIVAAMPYYNATKAMVVTNNFYTKNARELAEVNGVVLWDRNDLKEIFHIVENNGKSNS